MTRRNRIWRQPLRALTALALFVGVAATSIGVQGIAQASYTCPNNNGQDGGWTSWGGCGVGTTNPNKCLSWHNADWCTGNGADPNYQCDATVQQAPGYQWKWCTPDQNGNPTCPTNGTITYDGTHAHNGTSRCFS